MSDNKIITVRIDVSEYELQMLVAALTGIAVLAQERGDADYSAIAFGISKKVIDCTVEKKVAP